MLSRTNFDRGGDLGEVVWTIASDSLYVLELERVLLEGVIVRLIDWLGLFCYL